MRIFERLRGWDRNESNTERNLVETGAMDLLRRIDEETPGHGRAQRQVDLLLLLLGRPGSTSVVRWTNAKLLSTAEDASMWQCTPRDGWLPIALAPDDRDLELGQIHLAGPGALTMPVARRGDCASATSAGKSGLRTRASR